MVKISIYFLLHELTTFCKLSVVSYNSSSHYTLSLEPYSATLDISSKFQHHMLFYLVEHDEPIAGCGTSGCLRHVLEGRIRLWSVQ